MADNKPAYKITRLELLTTDGLSTEFPVHTMEVGDVLRILCPGYSLAAFMKAQLTALAIRYDRTLLFAPDDDKQHYTVLCVRTPTGVCPRAWNVLESVPKAEFLNSDRQKYRLENLAVGASLRVTTLCDHPVLPAITKKKVATCATPALRSYTSTRGSVLRRKFSVNRNKFDAIIYRIA